MRAARTPPPARPVDQRRLGRRQRVAHQPQSFLGQAWQRTDLPLLNLGCIARTSLRVGKTLRCFSKLRTERDENLARRPFLMEHLQVCLEPTQEPVGVVLALESFILLLQPLDRGVRHRVSVRPRKRSSTNQRSSCAD